MKHLKPYSVFEGAKSVKKVVSRYPNGQPEVEEWKLNNNIHREDGPAEIGYYDDGGIEWEIWRINGAIHRDGAPAHIEYYRNGKIKYLSWHEKGLFHREGAPAMLQFYPDGQVKWEDWYVYGKRHREDGPALIEYRPNGEVYKEDWWLNNKWYLTPEEFENALKLIHAASEKTSVDELVKLGQDADPEVRTAAKKNPNYPEDVAGWAMNLDDWT